MTTKQFHWNGGRRVSQGQLDEPSADHFPFAPCHLNEIESASLLCSHYVYVVWPSHNRTLRALKMYGIMGEKVHGRCVQDKGVDQTSNHLHNANPIGV